MIAVLDRTLRSVPMLQTLGIRAEEARTGHLVLRLPISDAIKNSAGAIHSAALFAVGELTAAVVLGTHPELQDLLHLQKATRIKYYLPSNKDVTAHATVTPEMMQLIRDAQRVDVLVKVLDGHGRDVAEILSHFAFRGRS